MRRATRCCGIVFHSSCTRRRKSARLVFSSTRWSTARFTWSHKCSIGHPPSKDTHLFATFEMGYPFIQSVLIQTLKQLWYSNHDSSVAMTQLCMCAKNHYDWLNNFGNMRPNPKGKLFLLNCLFNVHHLNDPGPLTRQLSLVQGRHGNVESGTRREGTPLQLRTIAKHVNVSISGCHGNVKYELIVDWPVQDDSINGSCLLWRIAGREPDKGRWKYFGYQKGRSNILTW